MIAKNHTGNKHTHVLSMRVLVVIGSLLILMAMCVSLTKGAANIPISVIIDALLAFNKNNTYHLLIMDLRLPRVLTSALIGAALAVSGAIMQGTTRNPLADSGLMGINAGAGLAIALCFAFLPDLSYHNLVFFAFLGAGMGTLLIGSISVSHKGREASLRMVLAGAAISALLSALSQGIALAFNVGVDVLFWTVGGVASVTWSQFGLLAPVILLGLICAMLLSPFLSILNMGEDVAMGLGVKTKMIRFFCSLVVLVLAGISVSVVGSVAFVGLIIPHLTKYLVGVDYRKIIPCSAILGALLLVLADLGARTISPPFELPLGVITSLLGVPFFLYLSRKSRRSA